MEISLDFSYNKTQGKVCKLKCTLYGLNYHLKSGLVCFKKVWSPLGTNKIILITLCL